ncbi:serine protease Do [Pedobacter africanus]|uniref:Serine protease Do n=1 Tax=Pedobacter africanus TaxID=151894 RepID=A0ACC6L181_9SPHI|nr:trypsin-like peptidase domain-containing protein [Pedobacter africanus]MDR6785395.1 serine protease Do [Pedobacter africanus]
MNRLLLLLAALAVCFKLDAQTGRVDLKKLEPHVQKVVQKAYQASVAIALYNATTGASGASIFSGVVVDTAGYVLSVAHAVSPGTLYQITFPDGTKKLARGLGRIASNDAAMLKITEKGTWPYASMGWSSSLQKNMPCISISYPGTVGAKTPTVRLGYVAELKAPNGYLRSTCLMEPGDSGGPLFDMEGRVIGLHSRVDLSLDANFEVPVDTYRKYWNALNKIENYAALPAENDFEADPKPGQLNTLVGIGELNIMLNKSLKDRLIKTIFNIKSPYKNKKIQASILGTLIKTDGIIKDKKLKDKSLLISKSSMVGIPAMVELGPAQLVPAKVISRDVKNDLVLLQIDRKLNGGIDLKTVSDVEIKFNDLGKLLVSPQLNGNHCISTIGNTLIDIAKAPGTASIGLTAKTVAGKVVVAQVNPFGTASSVSVYQDDELLGINGKPILTVEDLDNEIDSYTLKDTAILQLSRRGVAFEKRVPVKITPESEMHIALKFTDGRSGRYSGFSKVMIHDGRLKPIACGGPLYGVDGKFYGINIARFSRTSSLAIPAVQLRKFIIESIKN